MIFFDAVGIRWEYEKEGFELPSGRYLPDFWLPEVGVGCWFEVKGDVPTAKEKVLAQELSDGSVSPVFIFAGQIESEPIVRFPNEPPILSSPKGFGFFPNVLYREGYYCKECFSICSDCGLISIGGSVYSPCLDSSFDNTFISPSRDALLKRPVEQLTAHQKDILSRHCSSFYMGEAEVQKLKSAFDKARAARFEFSETI